MQKVLNILNEFEFFFKVAIACTIIYQFFYWMLKDIDLNFTSQVLLYWSIGSASFYGIGWLIEKVIKQNKPLQAKLNVRVKPVKPQPYPAFTARGVFFGEIKGIIAGAIVLYLAPEVHRGNGLVLNLGWFLMRIVAADFCFYITHWLFHHNRFLQKIHLKHHEFRDSSSFVAGHKTLAEYIVVTITDLLPIFIFGYDITQLLAWTAIGAAYNLEGHSSLSICFISSDFHDLHHSCFKRNYGIQGFWDRVFNTLNPPTKKPGVLFPIASLERTLVRRSTPANAVATLEGHPTDSAQ